MATSLGMATQARPVVLVVDDDEGIQELTTIFLERSGFAVRTAGSAYEGMRSFQEVKPAAAVVDIGLEGQLSGYELAASFRKTPGVSLIAVTGRPRREVEGAELFDAVMTKPVDPDALVAKLKELVGPRAG